MANLELLKVGNRVKFYIHGAINGVKLYQGVVAQSMIGSAVPVTAGSFVNHNNIWPEIPEEERQDFVDNFQGYMYYVIQADNGDMAYIGLPWINAASIELVVPRKAVITITDFSEETTLSLRNLLEGSGRKVESINVINT